MDFLDQVRSIAARAEKQLTRIQTEEATKNALVMPLISALGYNIFNPSEVVPEFVADVGVKKGEKVDYAVMKDGKVAILFECKAATVDLDDCHASQLYRYFSVTEARVAVLTNGLDYRFYSDLDEPNRMDSKAFLEFNIQHFPEGLLPEIKKLSRDSFDIDHILATAGDLKYTKEIKRLLQRELDSPSEDFVRFFATRIHDGRFTKTVKEQFTDITRRAFRQFVGDQVNERLKSALSQEAEAVEDAKPPHPKPEIVTTEEELEGFHVVKAILRKHIPAERITYRDVRSYFGVLLDDNNRKPVCRLWFNSKQKYLGLFDENKQEERIPIESVDDIFRYTDRLIETAGFYG